MKFSSNKIKKMIRESINEASHQAPKPRPFDQYYKNYMADSELSRQMYQTIYVHGRPQYSEELQELLSMAKAAESDLVANGLQPGLDQYLLTTMTGVERLIIHKMLKGELPMDYDFISAKMASSDRFVDDMRSGRYGSLD